jgi:hypothetical protein
VAAQRERDRNAGKVEYNDNRIKPRPKFSEDKVYVINMERGNIKMSRVEEHQERAWVFWLSSNAGAGRLLKSIKPRLRARSDRRVKGDPGRCDVISE